MLNVMSEVNWLGVIAATILNSLLGGIWFAVLFAKPYAAALGKNNSIKTKLAPIYYIGPLICGLITTLSIAILLKILNIDSFFGAISLGAFVGSGFLATTTTNTAINPNIPRPLLYGLVSGSFFIFSSVIISTVLFILSKNIF